MENWFQDSQQTPKSVGALIPHIKWQRTLRGAGPLHLWLIGPTDVNPGLWGMQGKRLHIHGPMHFYSVLFEGPLYLFCAQMVEVGPRAKTFIL